MRGHVIRRQCHGDCERIDRFGTLATPFDKQTQCGEKGGIRWVVLHRHFEPRHLSLGIACRRCGLRPTDGDIDVLRLQSLRFRKRRLGGSDIA